MWRFEDEYITNIKTGAVFEVSGGADNEDQKIVSWTKSTSDSQAWEIIYADVMPDPPKKGELNKEFGLYVQRPFHIVSALGTHRYLDVIGSNVVLKTPNGFNTQVWYFD